MAGVAAGSMGAAATADTWAVVLFWAALALLVYTYAGYPALLALWARLRPRPARRDAAYAPSVAVVVVGYNEAARIGTKIESCLTQTYTAGPLRVLIASDGSTDAMGEVVARYIASTAADATTDACAADERPARRVSWLPFAERRGKAACLNDAAAACDEEVIVFTDARQRLHPEAVARLVAVLGDRDYGAVSGELVFEHDEASGFAQGVDAYWRYEKYIRRHESVVGSVVGVTGALYAIRRECFRPIPVSTILDDVAIPMQVVMQGRRVGFEAGAIAYDRPSPDVAHEKLRKVRTLAGNFQLVQLYPKLLSPLHNPLWLAFFSHKLARLLAPLAMLVGLLASAWLAADSNFFLVVLTTELALVVLAWLGGHDALARRLGVARIARIAHAFMALNAFVVLGLLHFLRSRQAHLWASSGPAPAVTGTGASAAPSPSSSPSSVVTMSPASRPAPSFVHPGPGAGALRELAAARRLKVVVMIDRIVDEMGGTEGQVTKLVRGLQASVDVELVVLESSPWIRAQSSSDSLRYTVLDMSGGLRRLRFWRGLWALTRHLRATRPDVVHTFFPIANIVGALAARVAGIRAVIGSRRDYGYWMSPGYLRVTRLANHLVGHIVTNAPEVKRFTVDKEGYPPERIEVIYNGLELDRLRLPAPDLALKARIGIPAHHKVITLVANFRPIKRQDTLVEAFAQLCCERDDVSLLFVGGSNHPYYAEVQQRVQTLGLGGRVFTTKAPGSEIARYLSIADVGCNCSESEGLSNAVMEYMAAGMPCVVTRAGGNTDLVMHGVNGLLFDVGDAATLAAHLRRLLAEPALARGLADAAGQRLQAEMALPVILKRFEDFYRRVAAA